MHIQTIISGIDVSENIRVALATQSHNTFNHGQCLRRISLVVSAFREYIQALVSFEKSPALDPTIKKELKNTQFAISEMKDVRQLFLLLIRRYDPTLQSSQYLTEVICAHHELMEMLENANLSEAKMVHHLKQ